MNVKHLFLLCAAFIMSGSVKAQGTDEDKQPVNEHAQVYAMAGQLAKYGYEKGQALPLIQAAALLKQLPLLRSAEKPEHESEGAGQTVETKSETFSLDVDKLLVDAKAFADANGDTSCMALANEIGTTSRDVDSPSGEFEVRDRVKANTTDVWQIPFIGGRRAGVACIGDGDTDLDLYVYDRNGNLITSDTDNSDNCIVYFTPRYTGKYKIKIKNLGNVYNAYWLYAN